MKLKLCNCSFCRDTLYKNTETRIQAVLMHFCIIKIFADADGGPCSWVCACLTLRSAPIDTSRNFAAQVSGLGGRATILTKFLINFLAISGNSKHFLFFPTKKIDPLGGGGPPQYFFWTPNLIFLCTCLGGCHPKSYFF